MNPTELDECFNFVHQLVTKCGEELKKGFKNTGTVTTKTAPHDLVTFWDNEIERILIDGIKEKYPDHKFIAEEDVAASGEKDLCDAPTWIIDPIDGTINFVKKLHFVCISVALVIENDVKLGFLYNPTLNEFYTAKRGQGAFLNGEKIEASKNEKLAGSLLAHEISLATVPAFLPKYIERAQVLVPKCLGLRAMGSAALTLGYVASGVIDAYNIEDLKPWDIAAGALIVQEAGGTVIDVSGGAYNIMKPNIIAAGTSRLAEEIRQIVTEIDRKLESEGKLPNQLKKTLQ